MIEAVETQTGKRYRVLYNATQVSEFDKPEKVVVYALESMLDHVFVRKESEFKRRFEVK